MSGSIKPKVGDVWTSKHSDLSFRVAEVHDVPDQKINGKQQWEVTIFVQRRLPKNGGIEERQRNLGNLSFPRFAAYYNPPNARPKKA